MALLEAKNIRKVYATRFGGNQVQALTDVSFTVDEGEYVAIMGESGSGKTTLLNILAALDRPTSGTVLLDGKDISAIRENQLAAFRRDQLGFVFQDFNLLDTFSLKDNILLPLVLQGMNWREMEANLLPIANQLRIANLLEKYPYEVSGGQKQRAAVCRALITHPPLDSGGRTNRRAGFPRNGRAAGCLPANQPDWADAADGHALAQGGKPRGAHPLHP